MRGRTLDLGLVDDHGLALLDYVELLVRDDHGDLNELVLLDIKARHLAVDPDEVIGRV